MNDDIVLINKPAGLSSFGVVARIRRVLSERAGKKIKVGHTGTLDPFATGLMILVTGKECKNAQKYSKLDKVYRAEMLLGKESSTGDPEGELVEISPKAPTETEVKSALTQFKGKIKQRPPVFSAIKIDGQRAYKLARAGKQVDMPEREVEVFDIELVEYDYPKVIFKTHVSSGTYIRTLAQDVGRVLKTGAYCDKLERTKIAQFDLKEAASLLDFGITD